MLCRNWVTCAFFTLGLLSAGLADTLYQPPECPVGHIRHRGKDDRRMDGDVGDSEGLHVYSGIGYSGIQDLPNT